MKLKKKNISNVTLKKAIEETAKYRDSYEVVNNENTVNEIIDFINQDESLRSNWNIYQHTYKYAEEIPYVYLIDSIIEIKNIYFKN